MYLKYNLNMKILLTVYFVLVTNIIAADYSSESSGKETYKFSIDIKDGYSKEIRKTEETWTDSLENYGLNTCVGTIIKDKEKLDLDLLCENVDQEKQKSWIQPEQVSGAEDGRRALRGRWNVFV